MMLTIMMIMQCFVAFLLCEASSKTIQEPIYVERPRGVPLSRKTLYDSSKAFTCIDGSATMSFDRVNDDYCDCADGSDEPGTSACPNARFHCINLGHRSEDVPSSRVNDQLCDCCDGSDEYMGLVQCPNICAQLGQKAREDTAKRVAITKEGYAKRLELAKEGAKLRTDKQVQLDEWKKERNLLEPQRDQIDNKKKEIEKIEKEAKDRHEEAWNVVKEARRRQEATDAFFKLDINNDQKISLAEIQSRNEFDTNRDGNVSEDEAKDHLGGVEESELEHFVDNVWISIKNVVQFDDEHTTTLATPDSVPSSPLNAPDSILRGGQKETLDEDPLNSEVDFPPEESTDDDEEELQGDEDGDNFPDDDRRRRDENERLRLTKSHDDIDYPPYDDDTKRIIDGCCLENIIRLNNILEADQVRKEYDEIDKKYRDVDNEIKNAESFVEMDLGSAYEWAPLKGQCFEHTDMQYVYKLCIFDRTTQKDKNGHSETTLGHWHQWNDGGDNENRYSRQHYNKGQSCWNGPERTTEVIIECGTETKLVDASEPGRCEYRFVLETPAGCPDPSTLHEQHEEL